MTDKIVFELTRCNDSHTSSALRAPGSTAVNFVNHRPLYTVYRYTEVYASTNLRSLFQAHTKPK